MTTLVRGAAWRPSGVIRQGITLAGIDVVIVSTSMADVDLCRETTELAVERYGPQLLTRAGHPPIEDDQPLAAPIVLDGRLVGYVELAP